MAEEQVGRRASAPAFLNAITRRSFRHWTRAVSVAFILVAGFLSLRFFSSGVHETPYLSSLTAGETSTSTNTSAPEPPPNLSVNLVLASTKKDDIAWAHNVSISRADLKLIPYVADDPNAPYHPPKNKGNEAMIILTYLYEFYDDLPDISIFTHSTDFAWHNEELFDRRISPALDVLDLDEVVRRQYVNLKVSGHNGCPAWINTAITSISSPGYSPYREEEPYMKEIFQENFPGDDVPPIFASACCSQFAVTKEMIRAKPREQYLRHREWLLNQQYPNNISGRLWEHLWAYIFLGRAVDCPVEYMNMCRQYHICFETQQSYERWVALEQEHIQYDERKNDPDLPNPDEASVKDMENKKFVIANMKEGALTRGKSASLRAKIVGDLHK
ncbi:hypothetical protein LCER1_G003210 [Lachnellula cervina]|uniref:Uncharacterized protein n=1 Tax=Lachnellula cervina TaxID=1316786 RepID=A0A7D8YS08_9HELO|nr:hypothetical protein LCER1_G003210 [Lachnellula cervina]